MWNKIFRSLYVQIQSEKMIDGISSRFGWPDYFVFVLMLVSCSLVGIYFGFIEKKSKKGKSIDESDYLVGGRKMKVVPISMSLIARYYLSGYIRM